MLTDTERTYYLTTADYAGIVTQTKLETTGLTAEHYRNWYILRSLAFYRVTEANARGNGKLMKRGITNRNGHKMLARRLGRLYLKRKINKIKEGLNFSYQIESQGLGNVYKSGKRVAADHTLFLATELKRVATILFKESFILLEARLASVFNRPINELNPDFDYRQNEGFTGKRIAIIEYFRQLLTEFDSVINATSSTQPVRLTNPISVSPWVPLLISEKMPLPDFYAFLATCGLMTTDGKLTLLGRSTGKGQKAPWAGTLQALIQSQLLNDNVAWVCRALGDPNGHPAGELCVDLNEGTVRELSRKAQTFLASANVHLQALGLLRK